MNALNILAIMIFSLSQISTNECQECIMYIYSNCYDVKTRSKCIFQVYYDSYTLSLNILLLLPTVHALTTYDKS